jgi:hypothetical protein
MVVINTGVCITWCLDTQHKDILHNNTRLVAPVSIMILFKIKLSKTENATRAQATLSINDFEHNQFTAYATLSINDTQHKRPPA